MSYEEDLKPKYYTVEQLAKYSNLSVPTIRRYMRYEKLPYFKVNRRILIKIDEFDHWMEQRRQNQAEQQAISDQIVQELMYDFNL